eukprot:SAG25_NODE_810_length_5237_cov_5.091086_1_plen_84_part_10
MCASRRRVASRHGAGWGGLLREGSSVAQAPAGCAGKLGRVRACGALTFIWPTLPDISINMHSDASLRRKLLYVYSRTSNVIRT